jgi:hypothetical protein
MKQLFIVTYCLLAGMSGRAQTWDEWFHQDATARKYARQQLAALKIQLELVQKGYAIARHGLSAIQAIKKSNFEMHTIHFTSFSQVNPAITAWPVVQKIIQYQEKTLSEIGKAQGLLSRSAEWVAPEKSYLQHVLDRVHTETLNQQATLLALVSPRELTLSDDQRFGQIENLLQVAQKAYAFIQSFLQETYLLFMQRGIEKSQTYQFRKKTGL